MRVADVAPAVRKFYENTFIKNATIILAMTQIFCLIPVSGIFSNDFHAINLSYFSIRFILFVIVAASIACMSLTYCVVFVKYNCRLKAAGKKKETVRVTFTFSCAL